MSNSEERRKYRASRGARASAGSENRMYPLRKVVAEWWEAGGLLKKERLECGHVMEARQDFSGYTNAARRRCLYCYKGVPPD